MLPLLDEVVTFASTVIVSVISPTFFLVPNVPVNPYEPVISTEPPSAGNVNCVGETSIHLCSSSSGNSSDLPGWVHVISAVGVSN